MLECYSFSYPCLKTTVEKSKILIHYFEIFPSTRASQTFTDSHQIFTRPWSSYNEPDLAHLRARRHLSCHSLLRSTVRLAGLRSIQCTVAGVSGQAVLPRRDPAFGRLQTSADECLLEVMDDIVDVLQADRDANQVGCYAAFDLLLVGDLLMCGAPWVDDECLCVADVGEVRALE